MGSVADRYGKNAAFFTSRVEAVPPERWSSPSPCEDWVARDVVRHAIDASRMFLGFVGEEVPPGPSVDDDPLTAWTRARDAVQAALDDPSTATKEYDGFTGRSAFEAGVNRFLCPDLVVHSWDLARATGLDERLDPEEVRTAMEGLREFDEQLMRRPGVFGPAVKPPPDADDQTKLLAFLGRRV